VQPEGPITVEIGLSEKDIRQRLTIIPTKSVGVL